MNQRSNIEQGGNCPCQEQDLMKEQGFVCEACNNSCRPNPCPPPCHESCQSCPKQCQGGQNQEQGDLTQNQGDLTETQGDLTESLGDLSQTQGGETQGDQIQGDQNQALTGHGGQNQGDQYQLLTGHGGQTQGDQSLNSAPSISTPVNVSGVTLNLTVHCGDDKKWQNRCGDCRDAIARLLCLLRMLQLSIPDPEATMINFYYSGLQNGPILGHLVDIIQKCLFGIEPYLEPNRITVSIEALDAISLAPANASPNLFTALLAYLQSPLPLSCCEEWADCCCWEPCCDICRTRFLNQLQANQSSNQSIRIGTSTVDLNGCIHKIHEDIVYLVNEFDNPTILYAIPIDKIVFVQPWQCE